MSNSLIGPVSPASVPMERRPVYSYKREMVTVNVGNYMTVFEQAGAGVVERLWFAGHYYDERLEVRVNGETDPSIRVCLGDLSMQRRLLNTQFFANNVFARTGDRSIVWNLPIPFTDGIEIRLYNDYSGPLNFWSSVDWRPGAIPRYLRRKKLYIRGFAKGGPYYWVTDHWAVPFAFSGRGEYVGTILTLEHLGGVEYMERNVSLWRDREWDTLYPPPATQQVPGFESSGFEDFWLASFYWDTWTAFPVYNDLAGTIRVGANGTPLAVYRFHSLPYQEDKGFLFDTAFRLMFESNVYNVSVSPVGVWYVDIDQPFEFVVPGFTLDKSKPAFTTIAGWGKGLVTTASKVAYGLQANDLTAIIPSAGSIFVRFKTDVWSNPDANQRFLYFHELSATIARALSCWKDAVSPNHRIFWDMADDAGNLDRWYLAVPLGWGPNEIHSIGFTWDAAGTVPYLDGSSAGATHDLIAANRPTRLDGQMLLGCHGNIAGDLPWGNSIIEFVVYDNKKSAIQMAALHALGAKIGRQADQTCYADFENDILDGTQGV